MGAFSSNSHLDVREVLNGICKSIIEIFWDDVYIVRNKVKNENLDVWPSSVENEPLLTCNFTS